MWKPEHRRAADRRGLRYDSDLTDAEWALVEPLIRPAKPGGRPRTVNVREVLNAVFYVLWTGCQWKALPKDLPPRSTVWEPASGGDLEGRRAGGSRGAAARSGRMAPVEEVGGARQHHPRASSRQSP
jgi:transposase